MIFNGITLPIDVLRLTWKYLDIESLRSSAKVCQTFRKLTQEILAHTEIETKFLKRFVAQLPDFHVTSVPSNLADSRVTAIPNEVVSSDFFVSCSRSRIDQLHVFNFINSTTKTLSFENKNISAFSVCKDTLYVAFHNDSIIVKNLKTDQIQQFVAKSETKISEIIGDGGKNVLIRSGQKISIFQVNDQNDWMDITPDMSACRHLNPVKEVISVHFQFKKNKLYFLKNKELIIFDLKSPSKQKICQLEEFITSPKYYYHRSFTISNGSLFYINGRRTHLVEYELSAGKIRRFRIPNEPKDDFFVNDLSAYKCFLIYTRLITGGTSRTFECFDTKARKWINISINPDLQRPMRGKFQFLKNGMVIVESLNNNTFFFFDYLRPFDKKLYLTPALKSLSWLAIIVAVSCLGGYQFWKYKGINR